MRGVLTVLVVAAVGCGGSNQGGGPVDAGVPVDGGVAALVKRQSTFPDVGDGGVLFQAERPRLAVDGQGVTHALYTARSVDNAGRHPVRYGQCAGECGRAGSWSFTSLGDHGSVGGLARLVVTAEGAVRVVWVRSDGGFPTLVVGTCERGCLDPAQWTVGDVSVELEVADQTMGDDPLRVDGAGRLLLVLGGPGGFRFGTCERGCTLSTAWTWTKRPNTPVSFPTLALGPGGAPRVLGSGTAVGGGDLVALESCEAGCETPSAWTTTTLYWANTGGRHALQADGQGVLKAAFYQGVTGQAGVAATEERVLYAECPADCADAAKWSAVAVGLDARWGADGLGLTLDGQGLPLLAVSTQPTPYSVAWVACSAACATAQGKWEEAYLEKDSELTQAQPPPAAACDGGRVYWNPGGAAAVAWVPDGGWLEVAHVASAQEVCPGASQTVPRAAWLRYGQVRR